MLAGVLAEEYGVIQNVASIPYKHIKEMQTYNRVSLDNYHENPKTIFKYHFEEDPSDLNSESRRLFDWIKNILHKNNTNEPNTPIHEEVLDEKTRFRLIEKNLTETLTKLSHVLTQILNIVKYSRYQYFDDIHEFLPTKIGKNKLPKRDVGRFKRGLDLSNNPINIKRDNKEEINMKTDISKVNEINDDITASAYETQHHRNVSTKNAQENIFKMDSNKSSTVLVTKENDVNLNRYDNVTFKNVDPRNSPNVLKANGLPKSNNSDLNYSKTLDNGSVIVTTNIDSHNNITKRDVTHMKLDVNLLEKSRIKRDAKEINKEVVNSTEKTEIITDSEIKKENTRAKAEDSVNAETIKANVTKSGRRVLIQTKQTKVNDEIKNRLFKYIDEAFNEIMTKVDSLKQTKDMFSKDASYRVGYIISNIDTLEVNMRNLRMDMDRNKYIWDDRKILNLYDTVKVSNQAVSDLLEILKVYVEQSLK